MEHANGPGLEVGHAAAGVVEVAEVVARDPERHRVHAEVAPGEIVAQRRGAHLGERARLGVGLPPRGGQVERQLVCQHLGGAEALVLAGAAPEPVGERAGDRAGVALHGHVDVHPVGAAQQVAHRPAHEVRGREALERWQQPAHSGQAPNALAQVLRGQHQSRTGIPAARMRSLASRTL